MTPHADLVARLLRELVTLVRGECPALLNEDSGGDARLSLAIDDALAALPPPADPPHDCEAWRLEGLGCARCNKADPPALVALVREWQRKQRGCDIENTAAAYAELDIAEAELLAYPLPAAPPVTDTCRQCGDVTEQGRQYCTACAILPPFPPRSAVTDTPQGCPTCGGPRPCDRCTTSNVVDLDALKARLENERLRAAAEIVKLIADDSWAVTFQSLGQYRSALLKVWRDSAPAAPPQEDQ